MCCCNRKSNVNEWNPNNQRHWCGESHLATINSHVFGLGKKEKNTAVRSRI